MGALESHLIPMGDNSLWAILSMAAVMGGTMRSPLTVILFTIELTHDFNLMPALLVSCVSAYLLTVLVMRRSILTEKIARRGQHITREYSIDPLELLKVHEVMDREVQTVPSEMKISELAEHIIQRNPAYTKHRALPILDNQKKLVGMITRDDVFFNLEEKEHLSVLDVGKKNLVVTYPDEIIRDAVNKMLRQNVGRLPVVSRHDPSHVVGYLGRPSIFLAWMRRLEEEHKKDSIWDGK